MKYGSHLFSFMALLAFICGCGGATHQLCMAGICALLGLVLYPWKRKEEQND